MQPPTSSFRKVTASLALTMIVFLVVLSGPGAHAQSIAATTIATEAPTAEASQDGVTQVSGTIAISSPGRLQTDSDPTVMLFDLTAFIKRDRDLPLPFPDQTGVYVPSSSTLPGAIFSQAQYTIPLPIEPRGSINNVAHGQGGAGVMVFTADYSPNRFGNAYLGGDEITGWPEGDDSLEFDTGSGEVSQGELLVWSPDDNELFPTSFGPDGKLFTDDDPVRPIGKGWTVIKILSNKADPFQQIRAPHVVVPIVAGEFSHFDLIRLKFTAAFDSLVADLKLRYAYSDFKHVDWAQMVNTIRPLVVQAENDKSKEEFSIALLKFAAMFHDGHVSMLPLPNYYSEQTSGGLGMVLGQTDDGQIIVSQVLLGLPADKANIKPGAQIIDWNGQPIDVALTNTTVYVASGYSPASIRVAQLRYIARSPVGTQVKLTFQNPGDTATQTVDLVSVKDPVGFEDSSPLNGASSADMPVIYRLLKVNDTTYGYIKVNTFEGDHVLIAHLWSSAIIRFNQLHVSSLIVDVRQNAGGNGGLADYFAGSFYTKAFDLFKRYVADNEGNFVYVGKDTVRPSAVQWTKPVAILIGAACASACEHFAAAVAYDPKHLIVGRYPTAGAEASESVWFLPDVIFFNAPTGRIMDLTNTKPLLEGVGVQPTIKVPVTVQSLTSTDDDELSAAEAALDAAIKTANGQ